MTKHREDLCICETYGATRCVRECRFPSICDARPLRDFPAEMAKIWAIRPDTRDDDQKDVDEYNEFGGY
jgi:hypothetical protein